MGLGRGWVGEGRDEELAEARKQHKTGTEAEMAPWKLAGVHRCVTLLCLAAADALSVVTPSPSRVGGSAEIQAAPLQLLSTPPHVLREHFGWQEVSDKSDKAAAVWGALRKGLDVLSPLECASTKYVSPRLNRMLAEEGVCAPISPAVQHSSTSDDGTQKLLIRLEDGLSVECVIIPMLGGKHTSLCVSSQVGCSRACAFCSTGTMGLIRSLTTEEILAQVWTALRVVRERKLPKLVNVVFMGMGEPLNNFDAVSAAVHQLVDQQAFAFSRRNVCVSTVGPNPAQIAKMGTLPCRLAWSVHAADDSLRKLLVPTTRDSMRPSRRVCDSPRRQARRRQVQGLLELALMRGINDQLVHAEQLAHLLHPFGRSEVLVNLIPYNENGLSVGGELIRQSEQEDIYAFQRALWSKGVLCTVRATRGEQERSACGQLATEVAEGARRRRAAKIDA